MTPQSTEQPLSRVQRWERRTEIPMILMAVAFFVAYAWRVIDTSIPPTLEQLLISVSWTLWAAFAVDLGIRIVLAEQRGRYILSHWYDVLLVLVPVFRPLRVLRVLSALRLMQRVMTRRLVGQTTVYVGATALLCILLGAVAILDVERGHPDANITSFGDAIWWAVVTSATVGYGDFYPVTVAGRLIAVALMIVGIALLGAITAGVASWVMQAVAEPQDHREDAPSPAEDRSRTDGAPPRGMVSDDPGRPST
ncbi:potassium channel family protein [Nesterenkonia halophila]